MTNVRDPFQLGTCCYGSADHFTDISEIFFGQRSLVPLNPLKESYVILQDARGKALEYSSD
jgi:hypothetical protein